MPAGSDAFPTAVLDSALALAGIGVWSWEPERHTFTLSPKAAELYGLTQKEAQKDGAMVSRIVAEDRPAFDAAVAKARTQGEIAFADFRVRLPDGSIRWVQTRGETVQNGDRRIMVGTIQDASKWHTAEHLMHESSERFRVLVEAVKDYGFFMLDAAGVVRTWNPGAQAITGYTAEEIIGQHFSRFYSNEDVVAGKPAKELELAKKAGVYEEEGQRVRKDGTRFWAQVLVTAIRDPHGKLLGFAKVTRDVTEHRAAVSHQEEAERLRAENQFKARFINMAAHELQTPLTPIRINLTLLNDIYGQSLDEEQRKCLTIIGRNVDRLARLVDDVLQAARLQADRLKLVRRPIDLSKLVVQLAESFEDAAKNVDVTLRAHVEPGLAVDADPGRIEQVIGNLLTNAIKFTPERGNVDLRLTRELPTSAGTGRRGASPPPSAATGGTSPPLGWAVIEVRDSGIGMNADQLSRLFQPFSQVHTEAKNQRGTGLGLFISKGIVEEHDGQIGASSPGPNQGTLFRVKLALTDKPVEAVPVPDRPRGPASPAAKRLRELI